MYKDEVQMKNALKLKRRLDEDRVPAFIRDYFITLDSEAAKITYWTTIKQFLLFMILEGKINKNNISEITKEDLGNLLKFNATMYIKNLEKAGKQISTIHTQISILGSFWSYLVDSRIAAGNIIERKLRKKYKEDNPIIKLPFKKDLEAMVGKINRRPDEFLRIRNLTVLNVLRGSGLREAELVGLDLSDLHLDEKYPYVNIIGKSNYHERNKREVYLAQSAKTVLEEWIEYRKGLENIVDQDAVFLNKDGHRLKERGVRNIFKTYSNGKITPHMMRHLYGTTIYRKSKHDIVFTQKQLGHKNIKTTTKYYADANYESYKVLECM